jgi:hypothetical protein
MQCIVTRLNRNVLALVWRAPAFVLRVDTATVVSQLGHKQSGCGSCTIGSSSTKENMDALRSSHEEIDVVSMKARSLPFSEDLKARLHGFPRATSRHSTRRTPGVRRGWTEKHAAPYNQRADQAFRILCNRLRTEDGRVAQLVEQCPLKHSHM